MKAMDFAATSDWPGYFKSVLGKPARETLVKAAEMYETGAEGFAVDLAAGEGRDTLELLRRGWTVLAIEMLPQGIALLRERVPSEARARLHTQVADYAGSWWPGCDLFNSSFALPFCPAGQFEDLWARVVRSIRAGGRFAGQLFGDRDSWGRCGHTLGHSRETVERLFDGFEFEELREEEKDDTTAAGTAKHWHVFHIVARKRV